MPTSRAITGPNVGRGILAGPYYGNYNYGNVMSLYNENGYGAYGMYGAGMGYGGYPSYGSMYGRSGQAYGTNPHRGYGARGPSWLRNQRQRLGAEYGSAMYGGQGYRCGYGPEYGGMGMSSRCGSGYGSGCGSGHGNAYNSTYRPHSQRISYTPNTARRPSYRPTRNYTTYTEYYDDDDDYDYDSGFDSDTDYHDNYRPHRRRSNSRALVRWYGGQRRRYSYPLDTSPRGRARRRALLTPRACDEGEDEGWEGCTDDDIDGLVSDLECLDIWDRRRRPTTGFEDFWEEEWDQDRDRDRDRDLDRYRNRQRRRC